jgi:hypothetical protein
MRRTKSSSVRHAMKNREPKWQKDDDKYAVRLWEIRRKYWMVRHDLYVPPLHKCQ